MKGKKLAAKIMLGLLLATPYGFAEAAVGQINTSSDEDVNIQGAYDVGIYRTQNGSSEYTGNNINIDITEGASWKKGNVGVWATSITDGRTVINLGSQENTELIKINVVDNYVGDDPDIAIGIWARGDKNKNGGQINVNGKSLYLTGHSETGVIYGIYAQNATTEANNNLAEININTENTYINVTTGENALGEGDAIVAMSQGIINVDSNLEVYGDNAIIARGDAKVRINESGEKTTKLNGDINFNYDGSTSGTKVDAEVIVNLTGSESYWNGNSTVSWDYVGDNKPADDKLIVKDFKLTVADGAQWNPNKIDRTDSTYVDDKDKTHVTGGAYLALNNLTLNDGIVNLEKMENQELQIENLSGNGGTVNVASAENKLQIENLSGNGGTVNVASAENKLAITENNIDSLTVAANGAYAEELVQKDINESLNALANQVVDKGEGKTAATDVAISETGVVGEITAQVGEDGKVDATTVKELTNSTTAGIGELANVAFMAWRAENDEMHQRMGELRSSTGEAGIWARMKRGESESGDLNIKNQYSTYQLGYDEKVGDSNWYLGGAISRTEGKSSFGNGSGENQSTGFTVYGTYVGEDGQYVDLSAKYARLDNEFDVFGRDGIESTGDYRNNGYAFSAEYGKRIEAGNEFWVEPQVQLTYGHLSSANYTTSRGIKAAQDAMDSIVGRVGFAAGKDIGAGNVYVKASYLYDFDGDTSVTMNDGVNSRTYEQDLGGGWFEFGIGTNINLSETSHLYFDVERAVGGDIDTPWQWNAGVRFDF